MALQQHKIAAGYNNAAGLVLWRSHTASGLQYPPVHSYPFWREGELVINGDLTSNHDGSWTQKWELNAVAPAIYYDIINTYCESGAYYGYVTIATNRQQIDVFANYNAILHVPQPSDKDWDNEGGWSKLILNFFIVEAL
jgi:hypothetical protein